MQREVEYSQAFLRYIVKWEKEPCREFVDKFSFCELQAQSRPR